MLSDVLDFLHFVVLFGGKETRFITQKDKVQSIGASSNTHRPPQKKNVHSCSLQMHYKVTAAGMF